MEQNKNCKEQNEYLDALADMLAKEALINPYMYKMILCFAKQHGVDIEDLEEKSEKINI